MMPFRLFQPVDLSSSLQKYFGLGLLSIFLGLEARADWPQILGPNRDGKASSGESIPAGLRGKVVPAWEVACGEGFAGVSIVKGQVIVFDRLGEKERVRSLSLKDGKEKWSQELATYYAGGINSDRGPRCVPTATKDQIVVYGASGQLSCLETESGKVLWSRPIRKEYGAEDGYFGAGSSPLILENRVIVNVGGRKEGGIVAVDLATGKSVWSLTKADASYASPIPLPKLGPSIALVVTRLTAYAVDTAEGRILWEVPFGMRGPTVNASTPIVLENGNIFLTASYGIGACLIEPSMDRANVVYKDEVDLLSSQYATPVAIGSFLYANDGREDMGGGSLKCISPANKQVVWREEGIGIAHVIAAGDGLLVIGIDGRIQIVQASDTKFQSKGTTQLPIGLYRALPALSDGTLVVRDSNPQGKQRIIAIR